MPVPSNGNLRWTEIKDFAPGLWETGDWLTPAGAAQLMEDCYPQPGGGLRAFFKPSTISTTGLGAGERIIGIYGLGVAHRTLATNAVDWYCVTYSSTDFRPRIYRYDTSDAAVTGWTLKATLAVATGNNDAPQAATFTPYVLSAGTKRMVISVNYVGTDAGLWAATTTDTTAAQTWAKIATTIGGPITVHQSRLLEARSGSKVHFTGPGDEVFPAPNFVNIEPQRNMSGIKAMIPMPPGDLLVGSEGASWTAIQGDLTDPVVRGMSDSHYMGNPGQTVADTGDGTAFIEQHGGIYLTGMGDSFQRLDEQLVPPAGGPAGIVTLGSLLYAHHWLMVPRGYVFDTETKAWFRTSFSSGAFLGAVDRYNNKVVWVQPSPLTIYSFPVAEPDARVNSYRWKSASLRDPDGRQLVVREVQVILKSYVGTSSVTVTVNGVAKTVTGIAAGRHHVSFLYNTRAEVLDVQADTSSGDSTSEAPSLEAIRIGTRSGHLIT